MSTSESFSARWSRLKRASVKEQQEAASAEPAPKSPGATPLEPSSSSGGAEPSQGGGSSKASLDPASLPPIESLTAESDIKVFLQAGVPKELTRAALRHVWTADPAIRDFIGLAENQWDFTDPTAMPGFGPLEATDDVRQLVSQAMGRLSELAEPPDPARVALTSEGAQASDGTAASSNPQQAGGIEQENVNRQQGSNPEQTQLKTEIAAGQHVDPTEKSREMHKRRSHGGALPK